MATTSIKQLESFDSGSNYNFEEKRLNKTIPRSLFDKSHKNIGTMAENGVILPIALIPTIPNESDDISVDILLRALPTVVPLESRQRLYIYAFYSRMGDLWENFETFMKKGYSGNVVKKIPTLAELVNFSDTKVGARVAAQKNQYWESNYSILATSMGEALGLPHSYNYTSKTIDGTTVYGYENDTNYRKLVKKSGSSWANEEPVSALPFMMMLRIWRDYFINRNYFINDRVILPDCDAHFRLDDNGELISAKENSKKICFDIASKTRDLVIDGNDYIFGLPYHEYPKDRFTSALPFLQRGDTPTLDQTLNATNHISNLSVFDMGNLSGYVASYKDGATTGPYRSLPIQDSMSLTNGGGFTLMNSDGTPKLTLNDGLTSIGINKDAISVKVSISMNQLRKLAIEESELEAMARTDGTYAEFGLTFFGKVSKNAQEYKPVYIGGMYQEIKYTEVVQTSESGTTPMGSYTGHSTSAKSGYLGHIDTDDYGYIMILACVMPDVIYSEGLEKHWHNLYQSDMYLPQRSKLGMTSILKKEVRFNYYIASDAGTTQNNNLFAYQNIFDELRYIPNRISGYIADMWRKEFAPYTQSRIIGGQPTWGRQFALASKNNVRNDYLVAPNEPPFTFDCGISIRCVQPIPYKPIPASLMGL